MHYFLSFGDRLKMFAKKIPLQLCQTIAIGSFLLLGGKWLGHVDITWLELLVVFSTVIILDFYLIWQLKDTKAFPFSAVNTGIGISLFLRTDLLFIYFVAGFIAIFSKYIVAIKDKHFLNPSYSAIFICLVLFQTDAYVTHVQWGNDWQVLLPILIMGAFVAWRAKVWDAVLMFFVSWFVLLNLFMEYTWHDLGVIYLTGAFFIMAFHGFTDPGTLPKLRRYRLLFVLQIAILFFILRQFINEGYSFFAAYFVVNLFEIFFWQIEKYKPQTKDYRLWLQGGLTVVLFGWLAYLSLVYYFNADGLFPMLKTNRCAELFCQRGLEPLWAQ